MTTTAPRYRHGAGALIVDTLTGNPMADLNGGVIIADAMHPAYAARIVAALNHAEALAEALRRLSACTQVWPEGLDTDDDRAELRAEIDAHTDRSLRALAAYDAARQANS